MDDLNEKGKNWPMHLSFTKEECKNLLRAQELAAYNRVVSVFRAQGELTKEKKKLLHDFQTVLNISMERHRAEVRRAVNDEALCTIAHYLAGPNTAYEWTVEGRRLIPLLPRADPLVAYSALATHMAQKYCGINYSLPKPCNTAIKDKRNSMELDSEGTDSEDETEGLRYLPREMIPQSIINDHGSFTTLPMSEARCDSETLYNKKIKISELDLPMVNCNATPIPDASKSAISNTKATDSLVNTPKFLGISTPLKPSTTPMPASTNRRKRKRSVTSDPTISHRPQPVVTLSQNPTPSNLLQMSTINSKLVGTQIKPDFTDNEQCKISLPSTAALPQSQKVILVSTSSANSSPEISYIRSNSLAVRGMSPSIGKESITTSTDKGIGSNSTLGTTSVHLVGSPPLQIKPNPTTSKGLVQVRQDALCGRVISRTPTVPSSSQNLYVVTTNSGMITVVARSVASQSTIGGHRVVSVNTVVPRTSLASVKSSTASGNMSLTMSPKVLQTMKAPMPTQSSPLRPNTTKNNLIVLQRSNIPTANTVRAVGLQGYKEVSSKNVQRMPTSIVQSCGNKTSFNGGCTNQNLSMLLLKPAGAPTRIIPSQTFAPTCSITEVPARTMAPSLIYVEPNFGGKKTSTIRTTLSLTPASDGTSIVSSRLSSSEATCRVTASGRSFSPVTTIVQPSTKRQNILKESETKRKKDIKENSIPLQQINKSDKSQRKSTEPCITKITKLSTSLTNLYASTMSKKPAILSNNFAFAKSAKKALKDGQNDSRETERPTISYLEKTDKKSEAKSKLEAKSEFGDDEMSALVEMAVEVLRSGDKEQARTLLHKAGLELHESPQDDQVDGESFTISSINTEQNSIDSAVTSQKTDTPSKDAITFDIMKHLINSPLPKRKLTTDEFFSSIEGEKSMDTPKQAEENVPTEKQKLEIDPC